MRCPVVKGRNCRLDAYSAKSKLVSQDLWKKWKTLPAREDIPIIPHETVAYFRFLHGKQCSQKYSGNWDDYRSFFSPSDGRTCFKRPRLQTTLTPIQRWLDLHQENFAKFDSRKQITLLEGDAVMSLSTWAESYDFVSLWDSVMPNISSFCQKSLKHLDVEGGLSWMIFSKVWWCCTKDIMEVRRGQRTIYERLLQRLFDSNLETIRGLNHPALVTSGRWHSHAS